MTKTLYETQVTAIGGRDGAAASGDGRLRVWLDRPRGLGGQGGQGSNPEQLFAAGYAACFLSSLRRVAQRDGIKLAPDGNVTATVGLGDDPAVPALSVTLSIDLPGVDQETSRRLVAAADALCPYSNAIRGNVVVRFNLN